MRVLFVSKPIAPPFNDGSKCLVNALCSGLKRHTAQVLGIQGQSFEIPNTQVLPIYPSASGFAPTVSQNAQALAYLLRERQADLWHFVFAPNPRASGALRWLRRVRRTPAVQTIASPPRSFDGIDKLLFGDVLVAQSEWTRKRIAHGLVTPRDIHVILPPLGSVPEPSHEDEIEVRRRLSIAPHSPIVVYPGDLEFGGGADRFARMVEGASAAQDVVFVFACRRKTAQAAGVEAALQARLNPKKVRFAGELPSLLPLVKTACCVAFPVEDLFGKVDIPIALLETAQLGTPLLVAKHGPAGEIDGAVALPLDDTAAWLEATGRFVAGSEDSARVAAAQRAGLEKSHRAGLVSAKYETLYEQLLR